MTGGTILDKIVVDLRNTETGEILPVYIDAYDSPLARKWLTALNDLIRDNYHLEKNYCFFGFTAHQRNVLYLLDQINISIDHINSANLGYQINERFTTANTMASGPIKSHPTAGSLNHDKFNWLHRHFEELQGVSGAMSPCFEKADDVTRWHIRQLNLLCHEFESLVLSLNKEVHAPMWRRPSQLMCWLNAPRFKLDENDYDLFGVESLNRPLGGVFVGVNKAVGKHHWEVFCDEGHHGLDELTTIAMRAQSEAAGDFDIEWANNPGEQDFMKKRLADFRAWLIKNGFDPEDKKLTIGHPLVGSVRLIKSFGTERYDEIWPILDKHLDVAGIRTSDASAKYDYCWSDPDYMEQQVKVIAAHRSPN